MKTHNGNVLVLATGGSIAQTSPSDPTLAGEALLEAIPELRDKFGIVVEQVAQVSSPDITAEHWLTLASRINRAAADEEVQGIVVTHGTDTLEETAFFLNLVVKSEKAVVVVGAMRRPYALGADGAANLHDAVVLASCQEAKGRGVLVVLNSEIHSARDVTKTTFNLDAFKSRDLGPLGQMVNGRPFFYRRSERKHTLCSAFPANLDRLPHVAIVYSYAGVTPDVLTGIAAAGYDGVVWAGTGSGSLPKAIRPAATTLVKNGMAFVRSSRVSSGPIKRNDEVDDDAFGFITADSLNPQKARILLMLALTQTKDPLEIQSLFDSH
ncbi:L-asparaginase, type II (plasmid) [Rhizobium leguminosarum bv. trifolii WSM2304]|uniref:L-asparaginase, type II n=1 Tax=Rhizobium leguminosarum bv. trifolii (strain WSM2304) TaxID=395492 RepID=A0ABF7QVN3_RHILW|nr:asparaginase [Rhizobium leguminosarum]ACI58181.1 L-asparaginase, type II [Rhizobium leguminosarum bv. trifolii WSM2304]